VRYCDNRSAPLAWAPVVAEVLAAVDGAGFGPALLRGLRRVVACERGVFQLLRRDQRPWMLHTERAADPAVVRQGRAYLEGGYLLDPYYRAVLGGAGDGLHTPAEFADDALDAEDSRGWRSAHHVAFLARVSPDACLVLLLLRTRGAPGFELGEIALCRALERAVCTAMRLHWTAYAQRVVRPGHDAGDLYARVQLAVDRFGSESLTPRECEVIRLLLRGASSKAAAAKLGISPATAALHRKRAYAKLAVSCQAELFDLFIRSLAAPARDASLTRASAPLVGAASR
jgi:DNA-binding CsgD family transcriptional regulator